MINNILKFFFVTISLNVFTLNLFGFPMSIANIFAIFLCFALILKKRTILKYPFIGLIVFFFFVISTSLIQNGLTKDILSFFVLISIIFPLIFQYDNKDFKNIENFILIGFYITLPFVFYDLGVTFLKLTPLENLYFLFSDSTNSPLSANFGFYRVKSTFTEPSYYSIYLCALLYYFLSKKGYVFSKFLMILCIISTLSLSGFFILTAIILLTFKIKIINIFYALFLLVIITLAFPNYFYIIFERIVDLSNSITLGQYFSSEGSRGNSLLVMFQYFSDANFTQLAIGEGYGHYSDWLISKFRSYELVGYSRGHIFNGFALIGISLGVFGLLVYLFLLFFLTYRNNSLNFNDLLLHIILHFSLSYIVSYMFWIFLYFGIAKKNMKNQTL